MSTFDHVKFGDGLEVTDEGSGVIRVDSTGGSPVVRAGASELIYKYTVAGVDKASIDTGADTASAGTLDWTNGDVLEVFMLIRTDDAAARAVVDVTVNNDSSAIYDLGRLRLDNSTVTGVPVLADTRWQLTVHGAGGSTGYASPVELRLDGYAATTFWKAGVGAWPTPDETAATTDLKIGWVGYRSTTAITRFKVAGQGAAKLKVGSQLLIYKRKSG